ncbi:MAG: acyltransferase [Agathobacter sp.]|nr:acyltransferase [Agathobacter sp.]
MNKFKKLLNILFWILDKVDKKRYISLYPKYLKWLGINIDTKDVVGTWISPTVFWDSSGYSLISIGKSVTISFDVSILVHDFSIVHAARAVGKEVIVRNSDASKKGELKDRSIIKKKVCIGNNVFIGAKTLVLPGSTIGDNCIIGGGSVVTGVLEENSIYAGNPCKKIGNVEDFANKYHFLLEEM